MQEVFIVASKRTPIGAFMGAFADVPAVELGATALRAALAQSNVPIERIQELYFGSVLQANLGQAPATQVALKAGLKDSTPTTLVNKVCASGTKATMLGAMTIQLGLADIIAVGGMENMSRTPFYNTSQRFGHKYGNIELLDGIVRDGLQDVYTGSMMGEAGEQTADKFNVTREQQDAYAIESYKRAQAAWANGAFADVIAPVTIAGKKGDVIINTDEEPGRAQFDKMATLRPAFRKEGTITAANASKLNDGAAALILASAKAVKELGLKPLARIVSFADAARAPMEFAIAPADAMPIALHRAGLSAGQLDVVEINEAFSVVAMANASLLGLDLARVNTLGGAVSIGHPLGCSGARIIGAAITALKQGNGKYGAVGICNGGGGASALIIENV